MPNKSKIPTLKLCRRITKEFIEKRELGSSDSEKLRNLVAALDEKGEISYSEALNVLYPNTDPKKAENNIRAFRKRIKEASKLAGVEYEVQVSANRKSGNQNRILWINAGSSLMDSAIDTIRDNPNYDPKEYMENTAVDIHESDTNESKKNTIRLFISYAHKDENQRYNFIKDLKTVLTDQEYNFVFWQDKDILIGENFKTKIDAALNQCHYGLLLISPHFLESDFIKDVEIPVLIRKGLLPVGLKNTDFNELKKIGIEDNQVFTFSGTKTMFYEDTCQDTRVPFLNKLKKHILNRIKKDIDEKKRIGKKTANHDFANDEGYDHQKYHYIHGENTGFDYKRLKSPSEEHPTKSRNIVLDELKAWQSDEKRPPVFALLGDFGTGKTFTSRMLTHKAKTEKNFKPAFYCDLRWAPKSQKNKIPKLKDILQTTLDKAEIQDVEVNDIVQRFRTGEIIVIFDGLDEKTVYMTDAEAQQFFSELMTIMPAKMEERKKCRLLFTCRSHYFKTVIEQNNFFSGEQRGELGESSFTGMKILMLEPEQINEFLDKRFPNDEQKRHKILTRIENNPSISDLAKRPYLLSLICDVLPRIKENEQLNLASIYKLFVELWYKRDDTKHQLLTRHKEILLNDLATDMWKESKRTYPIAKLETWLDNWYLKHNQLHHLYIDKIESNTDFLSDDIRTASFLVRFGEADFSFAHSSLHEFFVARQMIESLKNNNKEVWENLNPNREIMHFFYALWEIDTEKNTLERNLLLWLEEYYHGINEILFEIWLKLDLPNNQKINLQKAALKNIGIKSRQMKDLTYINLENATLEGSRWKNVNLSHAKTEGFKAYDCVLENVILDRTDATIEQFKYAHKRKLLKNSIDLLKDQFEKTKIKTLLNTCRRGFGHSSPVNSLAYSPDGRHIASGSDDGSIKIWEADSGKALLILSGYPFPVNSVAYSPNGRHIASVSWDDSIKIWEADSGKSLLTLSVHSYTVNSLAYSPDGRHIVSGSDYGSIKIWEADSGKALLTFSGHSSPVNSVAYSPDGRHIASGSRDNSIKIWEADSGKSLLTFSGHSSPVNSVAYSPDGRHIASGSSDNSIKIWEADSGKALLTFSGHSYTVNSVAYSPDGRHIASGSSDNSIKIWEADSGKALLTFSGHSSTANSVAYSPDGRHIASGSRDNSIKIWEADSGKALLTFSGHSYTVNSVAYSPDGRHIASGSSDNSIKIWEAHSGKALLTLKGHSYTVNSVAYSPDGRHIASGSRDNSIKIWEADSGKALLTLKGHSYTVFSVAYSPDGRHIASGAADKTIRIWEAHSGKALLTLKGHSSDVTSVAYSPDGRHIASGSSDKTIKIWEAHSGKALLTLKGHSDYVTSVAYSPDGRHIASGSSDNSIKIWEAHSGTLLKNIVLTGWESYLLLNPASQAPLFVAGDAWKYLYGEALTEDDETIYFNPEFLTNIEGMD